MNITNSDDTIIDSEIFTFVSNNFTIFSDQLSKQDFYNLKIIAKYSGDNYTKTDELPFTVDVFDICAWTSFEIDPTIITSNPIFYNIGYIADIQTFT